MSIAEALAPLVNLKLQRKLPVGYRMRGTSTPLRTRITKWRIGELNICSHRVLVDIDFNEDHVIVIDKLIPHQSIGHILYYHNPTTTEDIIVDIVVQCLGLTND